MIVPDRYIVQDVESWASKWAIAKSGDDWTRPEKIAREASIALGCKVFTGLYKFAAVYRDYVIKVDRIPENVDNEMRFYAKHVEKCVPTFRLALATLLQEVAQVGEGNWTEIEYLLSDSHSGNYGLWEGRTVCVDFGGQYQAA